MRKFFILLATILALIAIGGTVLSLIETGAWWVRIFDFPRIQISVVAALSAILLATLSAFSAVTRRWILFSLVVVVVVQLVQILPFTALWPTDVPQSASSEHQFTLATANICYENHDSQRVFRVLKDAKPDLIFLVEVDEWWQRELLKLEGWPHRVVHARPDGRGLAALSNFPLEKAEVRHLVTDKRPSFSAMVKTGDGRAFRWIGIHPAPPGLPTSGDDRKSSISRDAELMIVAKEVAKSGEPSIVCGDFNDVGWSHTTRLAKRVGGLLDPRIGRGLFNTYKAGSLFVRYPIDHVLVSSDFAVGRLKLLPDLGSDHLGISVALSFTDQLISEPEERQGDSEDATEKIRKAK